MVPAKPTFDCMQHSAAAGPFTADVQAWGRPGVQLQTWARFWSHVAAVQAKAQAQDVGVSALVNDVPQPQLPLCMLQRGIACCIHNAQALHSM